MNNYFPDADWQTKSCKELNIKSDIVSELDRIIPEEYGNTEGIIIVKNGYIAYEKYFNGMNLNSKVNVASITKSIISALIGIAIDRGYISSADDKVIDYFKEYNFKENKYRNEVTIKDLLTMSAPFPFSNFNEPMNKMRRSDNWVKYALSIMGTGNKPGKFKYSTAGTHILSGIITKVTGLSAREFSNKYLFNKIGAGLVLDVPLTEFSLTNVFGHGIDGWVNDPQGVSAGGWGLTLTLRDMARFGLLYLRKGKWKEEQVISQKWIEDSIKFYHHDYGYLFWLKEINNVFTFSAKGFGGNIITVIPSMDTVVVTTAKIETDNKNRKNIINDYILNM